MKSLSLLASATGLLLASSAFAGDHVEWGYSGETGPDKWETLNDEFATCGQGKNQSPVNLAGMTEAELAPIQFNYLSGGNEILNNGHTIQVNYREGSSITVDGHAYELKQFHFHTPSENQINGHQFPLEAHLVHADENGNLAVVGVMFEQGAENSALKSAWEQMPKKAGENYALNGLIDAGDLLPAEQGHYQFSGSLTTPPCTEGVLWLVMKNPITLSEAQIAQFQQVMHGANNRPVQPLNARRVLK